MAALIPAGSSSFAGQVLGGITQDATAAQTALWLDCQQQSALKSLEDMAYYQEWSAGEPDIADSENLSEGAGFMSAGTKGSFGCAGGRQLLRSESCPRPLASTDRTVLPRRSPPARLSLRIPKTF